MKNRTIPIVKLVIRIPNSFHHYPVRTEDNDEFFGVMKTVVSPLMLVVAIVLSSFRFSYWGASMNSYWPYFFSTSDFIWSCIFIIAFCNLKKIYRKPAIYK